MGSEKETVHHAILNTLVQKEHSIDYVDVGKDRLLVSFFPKSLCNVL